MLQVPNPPPEEIEDAEDHRSEHATERALEREVEGQRYVPIIVKRIDERRRHPDDTLEHAIEAGVEQCQRRSLSLLLSAVAAGLILGFTAMAVAVVATLTSGEGVETTELIYRLGKALVYPLGFVVVIMSGTELFTEHTATAVYPVLDGRSKLRHMFRLWGVILVGNLAGAAVSAGLLALCEPVIGARAGYAQLGEHLVAFGPLALLASSILAGWMMGMSAWLVLATPPDVSQILSVYIVTFLIGLGGLHHSIAGAVEAFVALILVPAFQGRDAAYFLLLAVPGNLLGGSIFVAALNYGHIRRSREVA